MTGHLLGALARRGVEAAAKHHHHPELRQWAQEILDKLPGWTIPVMAITLFVYLSLGACIEYIIRLVYAHLAMVETPETTVEVHTYQQASAEDAKIVQNLVEAGLIEDIGIEEEEEPVVISRSRAITGSFKRTRNHVTSIGGRKARFRGLFIFIVYILAFSISSFFLRIPFRAMRIPFGKVLTDVAAACLTARLHCAWTHKVISMPSNKRLPDRIVTRAQWKELMLPTALSAGAHGFVFEGMKTMHALSAQACKMLEAHDVNKVLIFLVAVLPILLGGAVLALFILLPAYVSLVRKEASLLSPEEETIVPMDRTFGGRIPYIGAKLNVGDAWASFTWEGRVRLVKHYVKFFFVMVAMGIFFGSVLFAEFRVAAGGNFKEIVKSIAEHMKHQ